MHDIVFIYHNGADSHSAASRHLDEDLEEVLGLE